MEKKSKSPRQIGNEVLEGVTALTTVHKELESKMWLQKNRCPQMQGRLHISNVQKNLTSTQEIETGSIFQGCFVYGNNVD